MVTSFERRTPHRNSDDLKHTRRRIADALLGRVEHCEPSGRVATWKSVLVVLWIAAVTVSTLMFCCPWWHVSSN